MPIESTLNAILKRLWNLDEKMVAGVRLNQEERDFYNANLSVIKKYYEENDAYWKTKEIL